MNRTMIKRSWNWMAGLLVLMMIVASLGLAGQVSAGADRLNEFQFISPQDGETVTDVVQVKVFVPANSPLGPDQDVRLAIDGGSWQRMSAQGNGIYAFKWNTYEYQNGYHNLTALFVDAAGGEYLAQLHVNVCHPYQPCISP